MRYTADPQVVVQQPGTTDPLKQVENFFTVAEAPQEGRYGPNVQPVRTNGQQMAGNALQLRHEHADIVQTRSQVTHPHAPSSRPPLPSLPPPPPPPPPPPRLR